MLFCLLFAGFPNVIAIISPGLCARARRWEGREDRLLRSERRAAARCRELPKCSRCRNDMRFAMRLRFPAGFATIVSTVDSAITHLSYCAGALGRRRVIMKVPALATAAEPTILLTNTTLVLLKSNVSIVTHVPEAAPDPFSMLYQTSGSK